MNVASILAQLESKHNAVSAAEEHERANSPTPAAPVPSLQQIPPTAFVAAANGDSDEAARRWRATVAWRAEHRIGLLLRRPDRAAFAAVCKHLPHTIGRDTSGRAVLYVQLGHLALDKLRSQFGGDSGEAREALLRHACLLLEWVRESAGVDVGEGGATASAVLDLTALESMERSSVRSAFELLRALLYVLQTHYPESLHMLFVVLGRSRVVERLFDVVWRVARRCLDPATAAKVRVVRGAEPAAAQLALFGLLPSTVPAFLGGSRPKAAAGSADDVALATRVGTRGGDFGRGTARAVDVVRSAAPSATGDCGRSRRVPRPSLSQIAPNGGDDAVVHALPWQPATRAPVVLSPLELARLASEWEVAAAPALCGAPGAVERRWTEEWEAVVVAIDEVRAAVEWGGAQLELAEFKWTPEQWWRRRSAVRAT